MRYTIHSIIETKYTGGSAMDDQLEERTSGDLVDQKSDSGNEPSRHHRSEAKGSKDGFFHQVKHKHRGVQQVTNVNVEIRQDSDAGCSGCFKAIASILKR